MKGECSEGVRIRGLKCAWSVQAIKGVTISRNPLINGAPDRIRICDLRIRKGKGVGLYCRNWKNYILVNMKDKNIKLYHAIDRELQNTYKITKETGVYIMGENEKKTLQFIIDRHTYFDKNILFVSILAIDKDGKVGKDMHTECIVGDKVF